MVRFPVCLPIHTNHFLGRVIDAASDNLSQEEKRRIRKWKEDYDYAVSFLTVFGASDDDYEKPYPTEVNPRDVEYEPNPVIHAHLRQSHLPVPQYGYNTTNDLDQTLSSVEIEDGLGLGANQYTDESESLINPSTNVFGNRPSSTSILSVTPSTITTNGPATAAFELLSYPCSQCTRLFKKEHERTYEPP